MTLPRVFGVGPPKCATTTLHAILSAHPALFTPEEKELHFFTGIAPHTPGRPQTRPPIGSLEEYEACYAGMAAGQTGVDVSPSYFSDPQVPQEIHALVPDARIIMVLRDPVQRAWSHYHMARRADRVHRSFEDEVDEAMRWHDKDPGHQDRWLWPGLYHAHWRRYADRFGADQVLVLETSELRSDPEGVRRRLAAFLGIDPAGFPAATPSSNPNRSQRNALAGQMLRSRALAALARRTTPAGMRRFLGERILQRPSPLPALDEATTRRLAAWFRPEVEALEAALGRRLPGLYRSWPEDLAPAQPSDR